MKKNKTYSMRDLPDKLIKHSAQRSSELTMDYINYLTDYAKLNNIDEEEFLLNNLMSFPSSIATHLLLHQHTFITVEDYIATLTQLYNLNDGKDKHYFIFGMEELLDGCTN